LDYVSQATGGRRDFWEIIQKKIQQRKAPTIDMAKQQARSWRKRKARADSNCAAAAAERVGGIGDLRECAIGFGQGKEEADTE
jgi:hypothetical protein